MPDPYSLNLIPNEFGQKKSAKVPLNRCVYGVSWRARVPSSRPAECGITARQESRPPKTQRVYGISGITESSHM